MKMEANFSSQHKRKYRKNVFLCQALMVGRTLLELPPCFVFFFVKMLGLVTHQHSASQSCMIIVWEKTLQSTWDYRENSGFLNLPDYWVKIPVSAVVCHELSERRWWRWHCTWAEYMKRWTALTVCILCAVECIHCLPALFTCVWFCYTVCPVMNKKYYPPCTHTTTKQKQQRKHT